MLLLLLRTSEFVVVAGCIQSAICIRPRGAGRTAAAGRPAGRPTGGDFDNNSLAPATSSTGMHVTRHLLFRRLKTIAVVPRSRLPN